MKLEIKGIVYDMSEDEIKKYAAKPSREHCVVTIGEFDEARADNFSFYMCNTQWIEQQISQYGIVGFDDYIVINDIINHERITDYIEKNISIKNIKIIKNLLMHVNILCIGNLQDYKLKRHCHVNFVWLNSQSCYSLR